LEVGEAQALGVVDEPANVEEELFGVNLWDSAVVADEEVFVVGDFRCNEAALWVWLVFSFVTCICGNSPLVAPHCTETARHGSCQAISP